MNAVAACRPHEAATSGARLEAYGNELVVLDRHLPVVAGALVRAYQLHRRRAYVVDLASGGEDGERLGELTGKELLAGIVGDRHDMVLERAAVHRARRLMAKRIRAAGSWRVRGAQVPAGPNTDVYLPIDPAVDSHYCPDCLPGSARLWAADASNHPHVAKCQDCWSMFMLVFVHDRHAARAAMKN